MEIVEAGEIVEYEVMPTERTLYMTAVRYVGDYWFAGPSGYDKDLVIENARKYVGAIAVRLYSVKVPVTPFKNNEGQEYDKS